MTTKNNLGLPERPFTSAHLNELLGAYRAAFQLGNDIECINTRRVIMEECADAAERRIALKFMERVRANA